MSEDSFNEARIISAIENLDTELRKQILDNLRQAKNIQPELIYENGEFKGDIQQGDILLNMPVFDKSNNFEKIFEGPCVVLSNACDLVRNNKRGIRITYTPILKFESYKNKLRKPTDDDNDFNSFIGQIKKQKANKFVYLPPSEQIDYEGIVALDFVLSAELNSVIPDESTAEAKWVQSMSMAGWYMFISKLTSFYYRPTDEQLLYRLGINP